MEERLKLNRIKDVLDSRGISQTWLAKQLDMDFSSINAYCSQRLQPSIKTLIKIGEVLNLDFKELITDKEDIMAALGAGAVSISTTNQSVWFM